MCEFIGGDDACLGAALRVIASGGPCSVNAAAALARVARTSASCVRRLVGADSAPGLDGKETGPREGGDADRVDSEDAEDHAGTEPEGTAAARCLSAVIRSFLRRYADSDGRIGLITRRGRRGSRARRRGASPPSSSPASSTGISPRAKRDGPGRKAGTGTTV